MKRTSVEERKKKAVIGQTVRKYRTITGLSQQDFCDFIKNYYDVEVSINVINGIEHGRGVASEELREALCHFIYYTPLNFRNELFEISEKLADHFLSNNIKLDFKEVMSFTRIDELDLFFYNNGASSILSRDFMEQLSDETTCKYYKGRIYMNETAFWVYQFCLMYLFKGVQYTNLFQKKVYLDSEFDEIAIHCFDIKEWTTLDDRSKGRYMINVNRKLSFANHFNNFESFRSYNDALIKHYEELPSSLKDSVNLHELVNIYMKKLNKSEESLMEELTFDNIRAIYKSLDQCLLFLANYFAWCQHELIFISQDTVREIKDLFEKLEPEKLLSPKKCSEIQGYINQLEIQVKQMKNEEEYNFCGKLAYKLYQFYRRASSLDFQYFSYFEFKPEKI